MSNIIQARYAWLLSALFLAVSFLDLAVYFYEFTKGAVVPKYVYYAFATLSAPLFILNIKKLLYFCTSRFFLIFLLLSILNLIYALAGGMHDNELLYIGITRLQYSLLLLIFAFLLTFFQIDKLYSVYFILSVTLVLFQIVDFVNPGLFLPIGTDGITVGRAGSTLINPNRAGESLVILSVLSMFFVKKKFRIVLLMMIFLGVYITFSRSSLLALAMVFFLSYYYNILSRQQAYFFVFIAASIVMFIVSGEAVFNLLSKFIGEAGHVNVMNRIDLFSSLSLQDYSAIERINLIQWSIAYFLESPIFGHGSGYTSIWVERVSTHNQHLLMLVEYGLLGYLIFISFLYFLFAHFYSKPQLDIEKVLLYLILFFSIFTHNMLDSLYWLVTFALIARKARLY